MRLLIILLTATLFLASCKSENKQKENPASSPDTSNQQVSAQPGELTDNENQASSTDIDAPVQDQTLDQQTMQSVEQQQLNSEQTDAQPADNTNQAPQTSDNDAANDVNPYSMQQQMQPVSPQTADQATTSTAASPSSDVPQVGNVQQQPAESVGYTHPTHNNDVNFEDMPVPVSINGRPVDGQQSLDGNSSSTATADSQRLQGLIDRYDTKKKAAVSAKKTDDNDANE